MSESIFNNIFRIKYGSRAQNYDAEGKINNWDNNFNKLLHDLNNRKRLFDLVIRRHIDSRNRIVSIKTNLDNMIPVFEEIRRLRFFEISEPIIAQQCLMIVYGIKTCENLLPQLQVEEDVEKFYILYTNLWQTTLFLDRSFRGSCFWHNYAFKIGLNWLTFSLKVKEIGSQFFEIDKGYGLHWKDHYFSFDVHNETYGRNFNGGYHLFNPLYLVTMSVTKEKIENAFIFGNFEKEVLKIIESS